MVEFSRSGQEKTEQGRVRRRKNWNIPMKFTGTLIEDLMATVERAEQRAQRDGAARVEASAIEPSVVEPLLAEAALAEASVIEASLIDPWFASVQENAEYDSRLFGVA